MQHHTTQHRLHATLHVVYDESEHVVLYEEGTVGRLEDERLSEAVSRVFIHLRKGPPQFLVIGCTYQDVIAK